MTGSRAEIVKKLAREAGFDIVGIASVDPPDHLEFFPGWVERGYAGEMGYLANQVDRRGDVRTAFPWARTLVVVGLQYDTGAMPNGTIEMDGRDETVVRFSSDARKCRRRQAERLCLRP